MSRTIVRMLAATVFAVGVLTATSGSALASTTPAPSAASHITLADIGGGPPHACEGNPTDDSCGSEAPAPDPTWFKPKHHHD